MTSLSQCKDSRHKLKDELFLCLAEMNDVDPDKMNDESNEWMSVVDRGGLKHAMNMTFCMFASAEKLHSMAYQ